MCADSFDGGWRLVTCVLCGVLFSSELQLSLHQEQHKKKYPHTEYGHIDYTALVGGTSGPFDNFLLDDGVASSSSSSSRSSSSSSSGSTLNL